MKTTASSDNGNVSKSSQSKSIKKPNAKSRSKSAKSCSDTGGSSSNNTVLNIITTTSSSQNTIGATTPGTPTSTSSANVFDAALSGGDTNSNPKGHHKSYAGFESRSIKIIWEQHDQGDAEISSEVCTKIAEDASYKLWELVNNIKTFARHSGGVITYDLVNEVLRDADVPPALGAMDSDWDRIDYDGSFFFYSDKVIELRDEYQRDVTITIPEGEDFAFSWPVDDKNSELLKKYIPSLIYVTISGDNNDLESVLKEAAFSPVMGACYRLILVKIIQILAFKQTDYTSARCWRLLRACASNAHTQGIGCREEYFHLAEILICQLLAPYESIRVPISNTSGGIKTKVEPEDQDEQAEESPFPEESFAEESPLPEDTEESQYPIKMEVDVVKLEQQLDMKAEYVDPQTQTDSADNFETLPNNIPEKYEKYYRLLAHDGNDDQDQAEDGDVNMTEQHTANSIAQTSPYFASPIEWNYVDDLCAAIGQLAAMNGFFHSECLFHIKRRLERLFGTRYITNEREYNYLSRAVRGLIALGEYAFREFIPFMYRLIPENIPENVWNDFAFGTVFVNGPDDIFLYEWLDYICGADKLQPFMVYYAQYFEKFITKRFIHRKKGKFKIMPKIGVRRLEWSTIAAAMCHGDDPNKALKPKPEMKEVFPELILPNLQLNRAGRIRFKFAGCRPIKTTTTSADQSKTSAATTTPNDILIARRKLFKPLTDERRIVPLSSYYFTRI